MIVGGFFWAAGGKDANGMASWDGSDWSPLGSGFPIHALTVYDGKLITGGSFTEASGLPANNIASWDGSHWSALGSGTNMDVYCLATYDGKLTAGGAFTIAGNKSRPIWPNGLSFKIQTMMALRMLWIIAQLRPIHCRLTVMVMVFGDACDIECGDVDGNFGINLTDVVYMINYLYRGGPSPNQSIDFDFNGKDNLLDIAYIINFLYRGGPAVNCGNIMGTVTDIDGNIYQTVKIGNQWWMAENLKVTHYRNGEAIPNVTDNATWTGLTTGAYCEYNNDVNNVATYGRLYNWYAVDDSRNIAPAGWHVASDRGVATIGNVSWIDPVRSRCIRLAWY